MEESIKTLVQNGMTYAIRAYTYTHQDKVDAKIAVMYIQIAINHISKAEALYYSCYDKSVHNDVDIVFDKFKLFSAEFLKSHQGAGMTYSELKDAFDNSIFAFDSI